MSKLPKIGLILGGARSGKSAYAEDRIERSGLHKVYLATGQAGDGEMAARIAAHRERRGANWTTVEEPFDIADAIRKQSQPDTAVLVDCLTLWLTNLMLDERDVADATRGLVASFDALPGPVIFVSNEVGLGIVPESKLARRFRDEQGRLNQTLAGVADLVVFMAAGLPLTMKLSQNG